MTRVDGMVYILSSVMSSSDRVYILDDLSYDSIFASIHSDVLDLTLIAAKSLGLWSENVPAEVDTGKATEFDLDSDAGWGVVELAVDEDARRKLFL